MGDNTYRAHEELKELVVLVLIYDKHVRILLFAQQGLQLFVHPRGLHLIQFCLGMQVVRPKKRTSTIFSGPESLPPKWITLEKLPWNAGDATQKADVVQTFESRIAVRRMGRPGKFAWGGMVRGTVYKQWCVQWCVVMVRAVFSWERYDNKLTNQGKASVPSTIGQKKANRYTCT